MKRIIWVIIFLMAIMLFEGCTYQSPAVTSATTAQESGKTIAPTPAITPEPVPIIATEPPNSTISPTVPIATVTPDPKATFILTKEDFKKLKAPLTVLAIENEYNYKFNYDLKNGIIKVNIADFVSTAAGYFSYFYPDIDDSHIYERDNERYGIKKGDLYIDRGMHIPQKAINSIILSTFGKDALKGIDLNESIFDETEAEPYDELKDGVYIFTIGDDPLEDHILGSSYSPVKGNESTEFKTSYKVTFNDPDPEADHFSIVFKLRKDDTSEWGYNITAFNMQEIK